MQTQCCTAQTDVGNQYDVNVLLTLFAIPSSLSIIQLSKPQRNQSSIAQHCVPAEMGPGSDSKSQHGERPSPQDLQPPATTFVRGTERPWTHMRTLPAHPCTTLQQVAQQKCHRCRPITLQNCVGFSRNKSFPVNSQLCNLDLAPEP